MEGCGASVGICMPGIGIPGIWATAGDKPSRTDATTILTVVPVEEPTPGPVRDDEHVIPLGRGDGYGIYLHRFQQRVAIGMRHPQPVTGQPDDMGVVVARVEQAETHALSLANLEWLGGRVGLAIDGHSIVGPGQGTPHHGVHHAHASAHAPHHRGHTAADPADRCPFPRAGERAPGPSGPVVKEQRVLTVERERLRSRWLDDQRTRET
jgi:hypothetical protein